MFRFLFAFDIPLSPTCESSNKYQYQRHPRDLLNQLSGGMSFSSISPIMKIPFRVLPSAYPTVSHSECAHVRQICSSQNGTENRVNRRSFPITPPATDSGSPLFRGRTPQLRSYICSPIVAGLILLDRFVAFRTVSTIKIIHFSKSRRPLRTKLLLSLITFRRRQL